ncbi:hypothetical protein FACS189427_06210 [Planctomycetales bacterium]|nr:hypothetical protein FACS189427_06210 [Planctomycetales bacterium]
MKSKMENSKFSSIPEQFINSSLGRFVIVLVCGVLGAIFSKWGLDNTLLQSILWAVCSTLLAEVTLIVVAHESRSKNIVEDQIQKIKEKLDKAIEIVTVGSDSGGFEDALRKLKAQDTSARWIMSKFIAKQLANNFTHLRISIDGDGYTQFSAELYGEVKKSLFLTSSFDPYEWAKTLWTKNGLFDELDSLIKDGKAITDTDNSKLLKKLTDVAPHLTAWKNLNLASEDKKRIIVLHRNEWNNFFVYEPYFLVFEEISGIIKDDTHTKFLIFESYQDLLGNDGLDTDKRDYAVYDEKIILQWDNPLKEKDKTALELLPLGNADEEPWRRINELKNKWDGAKSVKDLKKSIDQGKEKLQNSLNTGFLNHSLCYYADGGNCWEDVNNDVNYKLGEEEQRFILPFVGKVWGEVLDKNCRYDILHIGIGCGTEIENIVRGIQKSRIHEDTGVNIDKYILADISQRVLSIMREKINEAKKDSPLSVLQEKEGKKIIDIICEDVFSDEFVDKVKEKRGESSNPLIVVLIANGYLLSYTQILTNIAMILKAKDVLLVTTENGRTSTETIRASYTTEPVLKLFNVSLNLIKIDTIDNKYFNFDFSDLPEAAPKGPNEDVFVGEFDISTWINDHSGSCSPLIANLGIPINFFRSYKPKTLKSITDYLDSCGLELGKTPKPEEQIYGDTEKGVELINLDVYSGRQIGLVIKKRK